MLSDPKNRSLTRKTDHMTPETSHKGVGEGDSGLPDCDLVYPTRHAPAHKPTVLPTDAKLRKQFPVHSGCIEYFPNALLCVAHQSWLGNQQHHPDKPLHWDKSKSADEPDAGLRHAIEGDLVAKAWRALAELERALGAGYRPWPYLSPIPQDVTHNGGIVAQNATDVSHSDELHIMDAILRHKASRAEIPHHK